MYCMTYSVHGMMSAATRFPVCREAQRWQLVVQFESEHALSVPKDTGRRGLYKTVSPLYVLPL
jgi:hypothetical protein